jgi:hypothetical protein
MTSMDPACVLLHSFMFPEAPVLYNHCSLVTVDESPESTWQNGGPKNSSALELIDSHDSYATLKT